MRWWRRKIAAPVPVFDKEGSVLHPCPLCASPVAWNYTCHTWGGNPDGTGWKHCLPCDSAIEFYCEGVRLPFDDPDSYTGCGWTYVWGLNPRNPRSGHNDQQRPIWLGARTFASWADDWR